MPRIARIVIPGFPHHLIQRGTRREATFFRPHDYRTYLRLLMIGCRRHRVTLWAYCLMTNHVHLIAVPETIDGLRRSIGRAHRAYSLRINRRQGWSGHLFQGRFSSYPLDTAHLLTATRYVERNPLEAGLVEQPEDYPWSSALAHITGRRDRYLGDSPLLDHIDNWKTYLMMPLSAGEVVGLEQHSRTGRPMGTPAFISQMECETGRKLFPKKRGPKKKNETLEL